MLIFGLEVAIEFKGGTILSYTYEGEINMNDIKSSVEAEGKGTVNVKKRTSIGSDLESVIIEFSSDSGLTADVQTDISNRLIEQFADNNLVFSESQDVNPTMWRTFFLKCVVAVIFSFIVLMIYIALRFKSVGGWSAGFFAILALLINVSIVFAVFVFFRFSIDANFIAVVLTILCYAINDTIVVFDRIRENRQLHGKKLGFRELVNKSVFQSFTRSFNTTMSTALTMVTLSIVAAIYGIPSMLSFAFPLLIGLIFGFVTSLFIAGPLWALWQERKLKRS
jgi:preprotein translocase subunit SecF